LTEEESVAVGLGLRLCAGNQGFGISHHKLGGGVKLAV
jgi:hypothetical protein